MKKYISLLILIALASCQKNDLYKEYETISNEEWCINNPAIFQVDIPQTGDYFVNICLRHTTDYAMANLWCFVNIKDSTRYVFRDTLNMKLAEADGRWLGTGNSIKSIEYPVNKKIITLQQGKYTFEVKQGMRLQCLEGIKNIGISVNPVKLR